MIVSSEIILLGDGMVFAHESSRNLSNERCACDFCSEVVLADLSRKFRNTFTAAAFEA